jgi:predicted methyltransferase
MTPMRKAHSMNLIKKITMALIIGLNISAIISYTAQANNKLDQAINSEHRSAENKARDIYRHPKATLEFFGFKPSMTIVELISDGLWYTEILAHALKETVRTTVRSILVEQQTIR